MEAKYYAAILLPMGLNAKLSSQRTILLIRLKCIYDSIQVRSVCRCNFGTKSKTTYCHWFSVVSRQQAKTESKQVKLLTNCFQKAQILSICFYPLLSFQRTYKNVYVSLS